VLARIAGGTVDAVRVAEAMLRSVNASGLRLFKDNGWQRLEASEIFGRPTDERQRREDMLVAQNLKLIDENRELAKQVLGR